MPRTTLHLNKVYWEKLNKLSEAMKLSHTKTIETALELLEKDLIQKGIIKE